MADGAPFTDANTNPRGRGRNSAPDDVWAAARADYLAGMTAARVCHRHGMAQSTLRDRAAREGWRRQDQPWTPPNRLDPDDEGVELEARVEGDLDRVEMSDLSWVAFRRMMRAVLRGDAAEALRWRRVREIMDDEEAEVQRFIEQEEALRLPLAEHFAARATGEAREADPDSPDSPDSLDPLDPVFATAGDGTPAPNPG